MNLNKLRAVRLNVIIDRMKKDRQFLLKEYGMDAAERFRMALLQNQEIDMLPESYHYLLAIEDLMGRIQKDNDGRSYLPEKVIFKYYRTPYFQKIAVRMDEVLTRRNENL